MQEKYSTIEQHRYQDYERFKTFERERRRIDEVTNASERLALPMRNTFTYTLETDGELYFQGERLGDIFDRSIVVAEEVTKDNPQFIVELIRRRIERQEYDEQRGLALGSGQDPDVLVVLSPMPDVVAQGVDLGAYDPARKKTLARIYTRVDDGIEATSLSLDLSDRDGLNAIARRFGQTIPASATSEDILAMRFWGYSSLLTQTPVDTVRKSYDDMLTQQYGGRWYAGRQDSAVFDAMKFIESQPDLVSAHIAEIELLSKMHDGRDAALALEDARYNFAAALARRLRGDSDVSTLYEAGAQARQNGETYQSDCPTGNLTAQQALQETGLGKKTLVGVQCPICGTRNVTATIEGEVISGSCGCQKDICTGAVRRVKPTPTVEDSQFISFENTLPKNDPIKQRFGYHALTRAELTIGGVNTIVYDRRNGDIIAKL